MTSLGAKAELHGYLRGARETLIWKLDGLSEYDIRRPLTPTGTNLLGLVKHSTATHVGYFGEVFGRTGDTAAGRLSADAEPNAEFWATPHETRLHIVHSYQSAWELSDTTILELGPDAIGQVPWWGGATVTLYEVLVHVTAETQRRTYSLRCLGGPKTSGAGCGTATSARCAQTRRCRPTRSGT